LIFTAIAFEPVGTQVKLGLQLRISQSVVVDADRHGYVCECTDYFVANGFLCLSFAALAFFSVNAPTFFSAEGPVDLRCARVIFLFFCMWFFSFQSRFAALNCSLSVCRFLRSASAFLQSSAFCSACFALFFLSVFAA
jgi:hypothetical protein